jgi:hypothetical protein
MVGQKDMKRSLGITQRKKRRRSSLPMVGMPKRAKTTRKITVGRVVQSRALALAKERQAAYFRVLCGDGLIK